MLKSVTAAVLTCMLAVMALADYPADRKAAADLMNAGKNEEALAAFLKMAGGAEVTPVQKSDAVEQAVLCAINLKKYDQAGELIKQLGDTPAAKISKMRLLMAQREWQAVVDQFKDENLSAWPAEYVGEAFAGRGKCALFVQNGELAAKDYAKAADNLTEPNSLGLALIGLGDAFQLLKDDARALEAYRKVYKASTQYKACTAAVYAAGILKRQGKLDEAIRELDLIDIKQLVPSDIRDMWLIEYADTLAKQGKKAEATAKYQAALENKNIQPWYKNAAEKGLKELQGEAKP